MQVLKALLLVAQVDAENATAAPRLHGLRKEAEKATQKIGWRAELTPTPKRVERSSMITGTYSASKKPNDSVGLQDHKTERLLGQ